MTNNESTKTKPLPKITLVNLYKSKTTTPITPPPITKKLPKMVLQKRAPVGGMPIHCYAPFMLGLFLLTCIFVSLHGNMH